MLKIKQVAIRLNLSESKVYQLVETGKLTHHRLDGAIRISEEQLADYLESTKRESGQLRPIRKAGFHPTNVKHLNAERLTQAWKKQGID